MKTLTVFLCTLSLLFLFGCHKGKPTTHAAAAAPAPPKPHPKTIHVFVALADNQHQGIVPVPAKIGNGDDAANNLYWGCANGVKTWFAKSKAWELVQTEANPSNRVIERVVFRHKATGAYLIADAYHGSMIKDAVVDFFNAAAGHNPGEVIFGKDHVPTRGGADLIAYVGHDGLMDFQIDPPVKGPGGKQAVVLACASKPYFQPTLQALGCKSLLLTTNLMCPEAYTLDAAVSGWTRGESGEKVRAAAARAYHQHQQCSEKAALGLFYTEG